MKFASLLVAPVALALMASPAFAAGTKAWGPYSKAGVSAAGTLTASGEDHEVLPTADTVKIKGKVTDRSRGSNCGWLLLRITHREGNNLPFFDRSVISCTYGTPKSFTRTYHDVYQVEFKVCSAPKASKPSLTCYYSGSWKVGYLSPH
ncbi:hypothetical protein ACIBHX_51290 [Nonomuraea sp. NPDC050536]|uniref:hypothetical protein n=1 Tax=Nonomuraea sp. NPDC050536 TaxID=3364366 RepID=UPI0037C80498